MKLFVFLISYLLLMLFTYTWRLVAVHLVVENPDFAAQENIVYLIATLFLVGNYLTLVLVAYFRGKGINKKNLWVWPLVAAFFDIFFVFIPGIPTILNLVGLIKGTSEEKPSVVIQQVSVEKVEENIIIEREEPEA